MKKFYSTIKFKEANSRRAFNNLKKRIKRKKKKYKPSAEHIAILKKIHNGFYSNISQGSQLKEQEILVLPNNFSIIHNTIEMLSFFKKLHKNIKDKKLLFLDMKNLLNITPDSILYMLSIFERMKEEQDEYSIKSNRPKNVYCEKLLKESGFLNYLNQNSNNEITDIFTIKDGTNSDYKVAQDVVKYIRNNLNKNRLFTKPIYSLIIECMTNTHNHAFLSKDKYSKWYLMAYFNDECVHFVFLDNGRGIPSTIKKNYKEELKNVLEKINKIFNIDKTLLSDVDLIVSALNGEFRTQTKEAKRGKGLPKIKEVSKNDNILDFIIISNNGYINCIDSSKNQNLKNRFNGTLFYFRIKGDLNEY